MVSVLILQTTDFGKFMNGYGLNNFKLVPEGWDWTDILVSVQQTWLSIPNLTRISFGQTGPYIYSFEHVVTSENGERPIYYRGWHQIDVLRIKA